MKNLEDYSAKPVCPSSYLTRLHMELGEEHLTVSVNYNIIDFRSLRLMLLIKLGWTNDS